MPNTYDLLIIGGGPAGLSAAVYGGRASLKTIVINRGILDGLINDSRKIRGYSRYERVGNTQLMMDFKKHAEAFGVEFLNDEVVSIDFSRKEKYIKTKNGQEILAKVVILACGNEPSLLNIPEDQRIAENEVAYCLNCDGELFEGEDVKVIGNCDQVTEEVVESLIVLFVMQGSFQDQMSVNLH